LFSNLNSRRLDIQKIANDQHSWDVVGKNTLAVYFGLLEASTTVAKGD